jgi:hypothetical protein
LHFDSKIAGLSGFMQHLKLLFDFLTFLVGKGVFFVREYAFLGNKIICRLHDLIYRFSDTHFILCTYDVLGVVLFVVSLFLVNGEQTWFVFLYRL